MLASPRKIAAWIALAVWFAMPVCAYADSVVLKNGRVIRSEKVWEEDGQVKVIMYGSVVGYPKDRVESVDTGEGNKAVAPPEAGEREYTGQTIKANFADADLIEVLTMLEAVSGKTFELESGVTGKVDLKMAEPMPWDGILDRVLQQNGLGMVAQDNVIRVHNLGTSAKTASAEAPAPSPVSAPAKADGLVAEDLKALARAYSQAANSLLEYRSFIDLQQTGKSELLDRMQRGWRLYFLFFLDNFPGSDALTDEYERLVETAHLEAEEFFAIADQKEAREPGEARLWRMKGRLAQGKVLKYKCDNVIEKTGIDIPIIAMP
ncbi:MAG: hypothetical protein ACLFOY_12115 [Desulfatibacillaceae bacterium]